MTSPLPSPDDWDPIDEILAIIGIPQLPDLPRRRTTVDREDALHSIRHFIDLGRHTLLLGPHGTGKSHLLRQIADDLIQDHIPLIVLTDFKAPHGLLVDACLALHQAGHLNRLQEESDPERVSASLTRLQTSVLTDIAEAALRGRGYIIIIDNLETLTPSGVPALQMLTENAALVAACKSEKINRIIPVVDRFNQIELGPMDDQAIRTLLWNHIDMASVSDQAMLERRILTQAAGNPGVVIDAALKLASRASLQDIRDLAPVPVHPPTDVTLLFIFILASVSVLRYLSLASGNIVGYATFGALSALGMAARLILYRTARK